MLNYDRKEVIKPYLDKDKSDLREELARLQRECIKGEVPVIIMIDGFESSNRGYIINQIVKDLDTKHYKVKVFDDFKEDKKEYNYTVNFWKSIPAYGDISVFYRSMYFQLFNNLKIKKSVLKNRISLLKDQEKLLTDDNHIILKFFLDIDEKTQAKNIDKLKEDRFKEFLVSKPDKKQQKKFGDYKKHMDKVLKMSDFDFANWNIIPAQDKKEAATMLLSIAVDSIKKKLNEINKNKKKENEFKFKSDIKEKIIENVDLTEDISEEKYHRLKDNLQEKAGELAYQLFVNKIPTILVFEGIDAAGKGGSIDRLVDEIDPRIYEINPTSAPTEFELDHHYLWRFYNNMPKRGHIAIFDRSWYGRVLVERVENFANEYDWSRAYDEINTMEESLIDQGVLLLKYNLVISKEEQKKRFEDRVKEKPYKITEEDWRNREKWDKYIEAMDDMIYYTSTKKAPWKVVSSENKKSARIEILEDFVDKAKKILD